MWITCHFISFCIVYQQTNEHFQESLSLDIKQQSSYCPFFRNVVNESNIDSLKNAWDDPSAQVFITFMLKRPESYALFFQERIESGYQLLVTTKHFLATCKQPAAVFLDRFFPVLLHHHVVGLRNNILYSSQRIANFSRFKEFGVAKQQNLILDSEKEVKQHTIHFQINSIR